MATHHAVDYAALAKTIAALTVGETDPVALMATVACEVHSSDSRFDWTGFYRVVTPEVMKIRPYQGGHGCLVMPFSRGVCGAVARGGDAQIVPMWRRFQVTSPVIAPPALNWSCQFCRFGPLAWGVRH